MRMQKIQHGILIKLGVVACGAALTLLGAAACAQPREPVGPVVPLNPVPEEIASEPLDQVQQQSFDQWVIRLRKLQGNLDTAISRIGAERTRGEIVQLNADLQALCATDLFDNERDFDEECNTYAKEIQNMISRVNEVEQRRAGG